MLGQLTRTHKVNLPELNNTSISIIIHPSIGIGLLKSLFPDGRRTRSSPSPRAVWFQPGAESEEIRAYVRDHGLEGRVVLGGPCILEDGDVVMRKRAVRAKV